MAFRSGNGGSVTFTGGTLAIGTWEGDFSARLTETTNSSSGGTQFAKVVEENSWSCDIPWDEANMPDTTVGLVPGSVIASASFKMGAGAKVYVLANTTVEKMVPTVNNATDIVRMRVSGKGGTCTRPV